MAAIRHGRFVLSLRQGGGLKARSIHQCSGIGLAAPVVWREAAKMFVILELDDFSA
jgi:hypothetical protein